VSTIVRLSRHRRIRHRTLRGLDRGKVTTGDPGYPRLRRMDAWGRARSTALTGTGTAKVFTATPAADTITSTSHGITVATGPFITTSAGTLPGGLKETALYWVSVVDANTLQLHLTLADAHNAVRAVDITSAGTGAHSLTPGTTRDTMFELTRQRKIAPSRIHAETDIDNLIP